MGKGGSDKQTGFWMYLQHFIKPKLQQQFGKRMKTEDLIRFGLLHWDGLSYQEKEKWKRRAKEYNNSEAGQNERMLKRLEYNQGKRRVDKLKPSVLPRSYRYDEVDQYSRKYFSETDDFEMKRENDRKELVDHYQWKFAKKGTESKKDFFYEAEIMLVTANVYYENSSKERVAPFEISILKFSIKRGIYDKRHYILDFAKGEIQNEECRAQAEKNEQMTGLLMECDKMLANVRLNYAQIWDEIRRFTSIDGDGVKLLLLSKDWNTVVGSFDALFMHWDEKSFSRIETRFITLEDYFLAMFATVHDVHVSDEMQSDVAIEMSEPWHRVVFLDSAICDFHSGLKYTEHCLAKNCSLFTAYKAAFNFFSLCKKHIFSSCEFIERHMPNKALLTVKNGFLECIPQQRLHLRASEQEWDSISDENCVRQLVQLVPESETLNPNVAQETDSIFTTESVELGVNALKRKTSVMISDDINKIPFYSERTGILVDLNLYDSGSCSCSELFRDASIPPSLLNGENVMVPASQELEPRISEGCNNDTFLKTSDKTGQTSVLFDEIGTIHNNTKGALTACYSVPAPTYNDASTSKSNQVFCSKVKGDGIVVLKEESIELSYLPKEPKSSSCNNFIPKRTCGSFSMSYVYPTNYRERSEMTNQTGIITKPFILKPVSCKDSEIFGWSGSVQSDFEQKFVRWLNSPYFESEISRRSDMENFLGIERDGGKGLH